MNNIFAVNTALDQAINRWISTYKEMLNQPVTLSHMMNSTQSITEVLLSTSRFMTQINWSNVWFNCQSPTQYLQPLYNFGEIQWAAIERIFDDQKTLITRFSTDENNLWNLDYSFHDPQTLMANAVNIQLDAYDDVKNNLKNQETTINSLNAAYNDWYQQTLSQLSEQQQSA